MRGGGLLILYLCSLGCGADGTVSLSEGHAIRVSDVPAGMDGRKWRVLDQRAGGLFDVARGGQVFSGKCYTCHKVDKDCGFDVRRVFDHAPEPAARWVFGFLMHEDSLVLAGDPYTLALRTRWNTKNWDHAMVGLEPQEALDVVMWMLLHE